MQILAQTGSLSHDHPAKRYGCLSPIAMDNIQHGSGYTNHSVEGSLTAFICLCVAQDKGRLAAIYV